MTGKLLPKLPTKPLLRSSHLPSKSFRAPKLYPSKGLRVRNAVNSDKEVIFRPKIGPNVTYMRKSVTKVHNELRLHEKLTKNKSYRSKK